MMTAMDMSPRDLREMCHRRCKNDLGVSLVEFIIGWDGGTYHLNGGHLDHEAIEPIRALCPDHYFKHP